MSSSSNYRSSQLHRVNLQSNGKRPFEECGYDSDPDSSLNNSTQASGSGSSGSSRHFASSSTTSGGSGEGRNKRARSTSSSSNSDLSSSSDLSTSTGYDTAPSSSRSDLIPSGPSRSAVDCPVPTPATFDSQEGVMSDLSIELPRPAFTASIPSATTSSSENTLRSSLERFNEFERQIAALRSSFATSRSPLPSQMGSSEHAPEEWHTVSPSFLSMDNSGLPPSDAGDGAVHPVPIDSFSTLPTIQSTSGVPVSLPPASSASSGLHSPHYGSIPRFQAYRSLSVARPLAGHAHSGAASASQANPALSRMASTSAGIGTSQSSGSMSSPPPPHLRPVRRSPSPLLLDSVASSSGSDDSGILGDRDVSSDSRPSVSRGTTDNVFPDSSLSFGTRSDSLSLRGSPEPIEVRHRVIRQHSAERGPTPSVFDVFGDTLPQRSVSRHGSPARERPNVSTPFNSADTRAEHEPRLRGRTPSVATLANRPNFHSRLYSVPSTNSLMSENAAEHRHIIAREQVWRPFSQNNGFELTDHNNDYSPSDGQVQSYIDNSPQSDGSARSEIILVPSRGEFGQGVRPEPSRRAVPTPQGGRDPGGVRRPDNHPGPIPSLVPPPPPLPNSAVSHTFEPLSESFVAESNSATSISHRAHVETSSPTGEWLPPYAVQRNQPQPAMSTSYPYTTLNLDSFQSGMFRDSLQRSADVQRPTISRQLSWNLEEDSDSSDEMDLSVFRPRRPPSPPVRDRLRTFATRPQRDAVGALDRTEPTPSNASDGPMVLRERRQGMARSPMGLTSYGGQSGTQPPNMPVLGGNRALAPRAMEPIRSQLEESRRRTISTFDSYNPPRPSVNRASRPVTPDDEPTARRPFAGGLFQRLANLQRSPDGASSASSSQPSSRVPPPPVGGRPTFARYRRTTLPDAMQDDTPSTGRISFTPAPTSTASDMPRREGAPWHSFITGFRSTEAADLPSGPSAVPTRGPPSPEERPSRLRSLRQRVQLDRGDGSAPRAHRSGVWRSVAARRNLSAGDYMPDELFDPSYEGLLSLSNAIGDVRSRATPEDVIASLPSGTYKEWAKEDSETRCPICLDDYEPSDIVTKLLECPHWLHKQCLEQWLRTANTCPVCRKKVKTSPTFRKSCLHQRVGNVTTPVANSGPAQNSSTPLPRFLPLSSYSNIGMPPVPVPHATNPVRTAVASRRPPRPGRVVPLVPTSAEIPPPIVSRNAAPHAEDHPAYPYGVPSHPHSPHHIHFHLSRPSTSRPSPSQRYTTPHPQSYLHRPMREGYERYIQWEDPSSEQLFLPPTPPPDQNLDNRPRPVFSSTGISTYNVEGSSSQIPRPDVGAGTVIPEPVASSFMVAPASSVTFTGPPGSPPITSRSDTSSIIITNSTQNPMVVTNRTSPVHPHTTSLSIEPANTSHHHVHAGPSSQVPHGPVLPTDGALSRAASGRWHVHTPSTFLRDRPSGRNDMYPWWE